MRVLLDTTYAARAPYSGTAVYIEHLCEELRRGGEVEVLEVANRRRRTPAGGGAGSVRNLLVDTWWTWSELPRLARRMRADVLHHPLPALARGARVPQVITVHDLAFERLPERFDRSFRLYAQHAHRAAARAASVVICVSETTAVDAVELWGVPRKRIVVAPHGAGQPIVSSGHASNEGPAEHFLYVGDDEPRKNLSMLIGAYLSYREGASDPAPLVLAGAATAHRKGVRIEYCPSRQRLGELYAGAIALVHPSLYEGFGFTALEAMSAGVPVLAADAPGLKETCGDAALFADPHSPASFAGAMTQLAHDATLREELARRGRRRVAEFSWAHSACAHLDAYSLAKRRS